MIIHLNSPERGDIGFRQLTFPDGQPHVEFDVEALRLAAGREPIQIVCAIKSGTDLLNLALALEAIRSAIPAAMDRVSLNISYLLGARMDRRIAAGQPATLDVIASLLNTATRDLAHVRVLDPHSPATLAQVARSEALHPDSLVAYALSRIEREDGRPPVVVVPDAGAVSRTLGILSRLQAPHATAQCSKKRDSQTGKLSGFHLESGSVRGQNAVIVDDICDGGGTFSGIAQVLRENGAEKVHLCVTHGVFSRGVELAGVDTVFATDSYQVPDQSGFEIHPDPEDHDVLNYERGGRACLVLVTRFMENIPSKRKHV